jgi:hypothetical protein
MRTVNIKIIHTFSPTFAVETSTQEIMEDEDEASVAEAGRKAYYVLYAALEGVQAGAKEDPRTG